MNLVYVITNKDKIMITILTKNDLDKTRKNNDLDLEMTYNGYDFKIPRETMLKSDMCIFIEDDGHIKFIKNRFPIEESMMQLKKIGINYEATYRIINK